MANCVAEFSKIDAVVCTTFTFNPEFFENNVLPLFFGIDNSDEFLRRQLVNSALLSTDVAVFHDQNDPSPKTGSKGAYRYQTATIGLKKGFFHPKNIIIGGVDTQGNPLVLISAASANLTLAGWGKQMEVFGAVRLDSARHQSVEEVRGFLHFLEKGSRGMIPSITKVLKLLSSLRDLPRTETDDKEVCFLGLSNGATFQSRLKKQREVHRWDTLIAISPYWSELAAQLEQFRCHEYILVPTMTEPEKGKTIFTLTSAQLKTARKRIGENCPINTMDFKADRSSPWAFRHAKAYFILKGDIVRVGIGSCNFTRAGFSENVESMVIFNDTKRLFRKILSELKEIRITEANSTAVEEEAPEHLPFRIMVTYDWKKREYQIVYEPDNRSIGNAALSLPGLSDRHYLPPSGEQTAIPVVLGAKDSCEFTVEYSVKGRKCLYTGVLLELNMDESVREYTRTLSLEEILESWRRSDEAWRDIVSRDKGDQVDTTQEQTKPADLDEDIFSIYEDFQAFFDVESKLRDARKSDNRQMLVELLVKRPDSLSRLVSSLSNHTDVRRVYVLASEAHRLMSRYKSYLSDERILSQAVEVLKSAREAVSKLVALELQSMRSSRAVDSKELVRWFDSRFAGEEIHK
jgi:hypothetical protein